MLTDKLTNAVVPVMCKSSDQELVYLVQEQGLSQVPQSPNRFLFQAGPQGPFYLVEHLGENDEELFPITLSCYLRLNYQRGFTRCQQINRDKNGKSSLALAKLPRRCGGHLGDAYLEAHPHFRFGYKCDLCPLWFSFELGLQAHRHNNHREILEAKADAANAADHSFIVNDDLPSESNSDGTTTPKDVGEDFAAPIMAFKMALSDDGPYPNLAAIDKAKASRARAAPYTKRAKGGDSRTPKASARGRRKLQAKKTTPPADIAPQADAPPAGTGTVDAPQVGTAVVDNRVVIDLTMDDYDDEEAGIE